ncbi:hypothetical protein LDENG_00067330 [Lucifuga dentata]|nr:hypothetical protein LDENG_00067330 [Lucifuga dentata]
MPVFPTLLQGTRAEGTLNESNSSSELPGFGSLQSLASSQIRDPDCLVVTESVIKPGQEASVYHQKSQSRQSIIPSNLCPLATSNLSSLHMLSGSIANKIDMSNIYIPNSNASESDPGVASDLINTDFSAAKDMVTVLSPKNTNMSADGCIDLPDKEKSDMGNRGRSEQEQGETGDTKQVKSNAEEEERIAEIHRQDVKEDESTGEQRGSLITKTEDRAETQEGRQGSTEYVWDTRKPETEAKDRGQKERKDGEEERGRTAVHIQETVVPVQTITDKNHRDAKKSNTLQDIDSMDNSESPLAADCSQNFSQKFNENEADSSHASKGYGIQTEVHQLHTFNPDESQNLNREPHPVHQEVQHLSHNEVQTFTREAESLNESSDIIQQVCEKTSDEKPPHTTAKDFHSEPSEPPNSQTNAGQSIKELKTSDTQLEPRNPSDITINKKNIEKNTGLHVGEKCVPDRRMIEPHALPKNQEISEQENSQLKFLEFGSGACEKWDNQSNINPTENDASETDRPPNGKSDLKAARPLSDFCVDIRMDNVSLLQSQVETGSFQEPMNNEKIQDSKITKNEVDFLSVPQNNENDASPKCDDQPVAKEMLLIETDDSSLPSNKKSRSAFEWSNAQRKTMSSRTKPDAATIHGQGSSMSEPNPSGSSGFPGHSLTTIPTFLKTKSDKGPLVITRASDLLNASGVSGSAASSNRQHQAEWNTVREPFRETPDMENRTPLFGSFSTSSSTVSRQLQQTAPGRISTSPAAPSSESDWLASTQEREEQQSSLRAQISKIEQFLCTERLHRLKKQHTDN